MRAILRLLALSLAFMAPMALATPVLADEDDEEEEEGIVLEQYPDFLFNKAAAGLNAVITAPADPVMFSIEGDEVFPDFWQPQVTGRMMGFVVGLFQMPYRMVTGAFDVATAPLATVMPMTSPAPRFHLIPHMHDDE